MGCILGGEERRIGSLDGQGTAINTCFVGSRIMKGNVEANQNISITFDPANLKCIACEPEHRILNSDSPACICVTDQNFPANLSGNGNCISVVQLESASLPELADLCSELFESATFPAGLVICLRSTSHLHRVGVTLYSVDWKDSAARISKLIRWLQVCVPYSADSGFNTGFAGNGSSSACQLVCQSLRGQCPWANCHVGNTGIMLNHRGGRSLPTLSDSRIAHQPGTRCRAHRTPLPEHQPAPRAVLWTRC